MPPDRDPDAHARFAFFRDGRPTSVPSRLPVRLAALGILAERFEPGRRYPERTVSAMLADDSPDHATLRRLLVDHGFLERRAGLYWRRTTTPDEPAM